MFSSFIHLITPVESFCDCVAVDNLVQGHVIPPPAKIDTKRRDMSAVSI